MTVKVDLKRCNGCRQLDEPQCRKLCPGDLMQISSVNGKAYINGERDCWDCMVCVKACPMMAVQTKLPYSIAYFGASLRPKAKKDMIEWTLEDGTGKVETFHIKTRF